MEETYSSDPEKNVEQARVTTIDKDVNGTVLEKHKVKDQVDDLSEVEASKGFFGSWVKGISFLRAEERGIERVKEEDRVDQSVLDGFTMWASANFTYV